VVIGAGGVGKALAFGAKARGAKVIIANRTIQRAQELADKVGGEAITLAQLDEMKAQLGFVLTNSFSVGMQPNFHESPIATSALKGYELVFDVVYTPRVTITLRGRGVGSCNC
jgi:3-dehydroquinate dehydratase/shikimate dehydrogenase